ncbi:MAG TPA: hypothetical protein VNO55_08805 [Polyangia bacterium]|nr:hypothetical protein [Polyangia bacterium]
MSASARGGRGGRLVLSGFELLTAVGNDARQTCASIRAGVSRIAEYPFFAPTTLDPGWDEQEPVMVAAVKTVPFELPLRARLVALGAQVLRALPGQVPLTRADLAQTALLVALPWADDAVKEAQIPTRLVPELLHACGLPDFPVMRTVAGGHTAVFELIELAEKLLAQQQAASAIVLAVDSYLGGQRLALLDQAWRLRSARNVDGFVPGEAAAALFIETQTAARRRAGKVAALIGSVGRGSEPNLVTSDDQSTGRGLTDAIDQAFAESTTTGLCPWVLCDMNGESYRAYEWGLARTRIPARLGSVGRLVHPADCIGDVGAVTGAVLLGIAAGGFARNYAPAGEALLWTASDGPTRAAVCVEAPVP